MAEKKRKSRKRVKLPEALEKRLGVYALTAAAAGAGMLAMAVPAQANDITVVNPSLTVGPKGHTTLSINGNSILKLTATVGQSGIVLAGHLDLKAGSQAAFMGSHPLQAARLYAESWISASASFLKSATLATNFATFGGFKTVGHNWANQSGYLGFKFLSNSNTYFGWAHLKVTADAITGETASISQFAYDTCPNEGIAAGQTHNSNTCSQPTNTPEPGTLSLLAMGAVGLFALRRKKLAGSN